MKSNKLINSSIILRLIMSLIIILVMISISGCVKKSSKDLTDYHEKYNITVNIEKQAAKESDLFNVLDNAIKTEESSLMGTYIIYSIKNNNPLTETIKFNFNIKSYKDFKFIYETNEKKLNQYVIDNYLYTYHDDRFFDKKTYKENPELGDSTLISIKRKMLNEYLFKNKISLRDIIKVVKSDYQQKMYNHYSFGYDKTNNFIVEYGYGSYTYRFVFVNKMLKYYEFKDSSDSNNQGYLVNSYEQPNFNYPNFKNNIIDLD